MKRLVVAIAALFACKSGDHAAPPPPAAPVAPTPDAAPAQAAPSFSQTISADGIGPVTATTDPKTIATIFPGAELKAEHVDREGHSIDETVLSLRNGPVIARVVVDNMLSDKQVARVDALGSMFAVQGGLRVGSSVAELVAKYADGECRRETYAHNPEGFATALYCASPSLPNVQFHLDPAGFPGDADGKVLAARIANLKFVRITWRPKLAIQAAGDASGQPFCFPPNTELAVDRFTATDDGATFCGPVEGKLTCVSLAFATGAFTGTVGAVPPPTVVEPSQRVSSDGAWKLVVTGKTLALVDTKTGKSSTSLSAMDGDFKCLENARFLGDDIYVTTAVCNQPRSIGLIYSPAGKRIGDKLDGVNLQGAKPFRLRGDRWAFHGADAENVLIVDVANGDHGVIDLLAGDQAHCCDVHVKPTIPPFALTPKGKLVTLGGVVAVLDLAAGKAAQAWPLPSCAK